MWSRGGPSPGGIDRWVRTKQPNSLRSYIILLKIHTSVGNLNFRLYYFHTPVPVSDPDCSYLYPYPENHTRSDFFEKKPSVAVADPDPGSGAFFTPRPGSQTYIFENMVINFLVKSSIIL
jgi:hypothetical protein